MQGSHRLNWLLPDLCGQPAVHRPALIDAIVDLSRLALSLRDSIAEIDINPLIANANGALAVDAMILRRSANR